MWQFQRSRVMLAAFLLLSFISVYHLLPRTPESSDLFSSKDSLSVSTVKRPNDPKLHLLLPTTSGDVNLCKTILSAKALGYPEPVILGWGGKFDTWYLIAGGSHIAKISKVLEYLESLGPEQDDELVLMMDAFDIWFQLPPETLIERYYSINERANKRISKHMGKAAEIEGIKQTIVFGAGKRCAPNQPHTIACYTVPVSPVPDDIYGANTDTIIGHNKYTSNRQRYINCGYIIGPAKDMRVMFKKAWEKAQSWPEVSEWDNGSGGSGFMYHGSDQAAFAAMFGEQQYQREVMRRHHASTWTSRYRRLMQDSPAISIEGTQIGDILNPPFTHETIRPLEDPRSCEFGMGMDYFSDLGHQTMNSGEDAAWLRYDDPREVFLNKTRQGRNDFDCQYRGDFKVPADMKLYDERQFLPRNRTWEQVNLYTNLCMGTIPVMAHYNGDKKERERQWPQFWVQQYGKWIVENTERLGGGRIGASLFKKGEETQFMDWDALCPAEYSEELHRGDDQTLDQ
ncbi:hypothetical protein D6C90_04770 [Aureobasidium pullulans]|uniref:Uncharacterized protein n=1 Tax=Aureobasidium pullulans TaxID=5580 RepID=A0A4S9UZ52_AURPU|nr:hypothetical protein D6C90_04770 [Aureobasidium pullulans]